MLMTTAHHAISSEFQFQQLSTVHHHEFDKVIEFVMSSRKQLFPMLDHRQLPDDLAHFQQTFIDDDLGCFIKLEYRSQLIGVVGFKRYDHRFKNFNLTAEPAVEIVKLFIHQDFRQLGLASILIHQLKTVALHKRIKILYLHTHPFLQGAEAFWLKQGFTPIIREIDAIWNTLHMRFDLTNENN